MENRAALYPSILQGSRRPATARELANAAEWAERGAEAGEICTLIFWADIWKVAREGDCGSATPDSVFPQAISVA